MNALIASSVNGQLSSCLVTKHLNTGMVMRIGEVDRHLQRYLVLGR